MEPHSTTNTPMPVTPPPLRITIRFATHQIPDLPLLLQPSALALRIHNLRHAIRPHLPPDLSDRALRLIQAGRVLEGEWSIGVALRVQGTAAERTGRWKGKGRAGGLAVDGEANGDVEALANGEALTLGTGLVEGIQKDPDARKTNIFERIYVHCSISPTVLTAAQLAAEQRISDSNDSASVSNVFAVAEGANGRPRGDTNSSTTSTAVQGFDRLLATAGFSAEDVSNLRSQFRGIVSSRHTPDTMPSPRSLLRMEESWLDGDASESGVGRSRRGTNGGAAEDGIIAADGGLNEEDTPRAQMYDTLYGVCTGFFWPLGALAWGLKEEGVWSRRRGLAVLAGVGVNIGFGLVKVLG